MKKRRAGFTLVELMVVVAIIGLLATVVTVSVISQKEGADRTRVSADMKSIGNALDLFKLNMGYYPNALDELNTRVLDDINATGEVFLSHTRLGGRVALRLAVGHIRTTEHHVRRAWELLNEALDGNDPIPS